VEATFDLSAETTTVEVAGTNTVAGIEAVGDGGWHQI